jgi:hypothetical protein
LIANPLCQFFRLQAAASADWFLHGLLTEVGAAMRAAGQGLTVRIQVPTSNLLLAKRATATSEEREEYRGADNDGEDRPKPTARPNRFDSVVQR